MTEKMQVYKCELCGNMLETIHKGGGAFVCCGQEMGLLIENSVDAAKEKHVPVIEVTGDQINVKVGSVAHPMVDNHYIEWVQVIDGESSSRTFLKPGEKPEVSFKMKSSNVEARAYCNLHGLWKGE